MKREGGLRTARPNLGESLVILGSVAIWLFWDLVTFVFVVFAESASATRMSWGDWQPVVVMAAIPLTILAVAGGWRARRASVLPTTAFGHGLLVAQGLGVLGLAAAILTPIVALGSYLHPSGHLTIDNQVPYASMVTVSGHLNEGSCESFKVIDPGTRTEVSAVLDGWECWGDSLASIEVFNALGIWKCDWPKSGSAAALVITEAGPNCQQTSYEPGILRQPPALTPGPPISPPRAGATPH
jgi:hypothetical protein